MKLVTSYNSPDLDGFACAYAYAELLNERGEKAKAAIFGTPHREARFVMDRFGIVAPPRVDPRQVHEREWILVDCSTFPGLPGEVEPGRVVEIIDHREVHEAQKFSHAKAQIEMVGAAATLVAERFAEKGTPISQASAALLYAAIVSNTADFKSTHTTERDRHAAAWLRDRADIPHAFAQELFRAKSRLDGTLAEIFKEDLATFTDARLGIVQLEVMGALEILKTRETEAAMALNQLSRERGVERIFITAIDLEKGCNAYFSTDPVTRQVLEQGLGVAFSGYLATREGVTFRKQIVPVLLPLFRTL